MRIVSGKLKGRIIPNKKIEGTRPTMDRVKESLFAMIQDYIEESVFVDLFAGSGSIGIEAISNGAKKCYFVDKNYLCIEQIKQAIRKFDIGAYAVVIKSDYKAVLKKWKEENIHFDILFLDPPYKLNCYEEILAFVIKNDMLNENGLVICEYSHILLKEEYEYLKLFKTKKYSDKSINIYRKE